MSNQQASVFKPETIRAALAELIGTFFLTLAALLSGTPYAVGLALATLVYAIGDISGSHVNPAITIGILLKRSIEFSTAALYIIAQIVGAISARAVSGLVGNLAPDYQAAGGFAEFFGFGLLMLTVVSVYEKNVPKAGSGVAVGAALAAGLLTTKGILNPAVAIAMGEAMSPATWATLLSGIVFTALFQVFLSKALIRPGA